MVLAYVSIEGWIIHPDVNSLFNGSDEVLVLPPHSTEIINGGIMTCGVLVVIYLRTTAINTTDNDTTIEDPIVCHPATHVGYGMHQIFGMHMICFSCFYFCSSRNFL